MRTLLKSRIFAVAFTLSLLAASFAVVDLGHVPITLSPSSSTISPGTPVSVTLTLNGTSSQDQTISITSSDSSKLTVPATVTVAAGNSSTTFTATANTGVEGLLASTDSSVVTVTASCNGGSASTQITIQ